MVATSASFLASSTDTDDAPQMVEYGRVLTRTFRPAASRPVAIGVWATAVAVAVGGTSAGDVRTAAAALSGAALGALAAWALFWRPEVVVSPGGVTLVNVLRTVHVPWPVLDDAVAGWSLEVRVGTRTWTAWAAPRARDAHRATGGSRLRVQCRLTGGAEAATSDTTATAVRAMHDALVAAGHLDGARSTAEQHGLRETVTWHRATVAGVLALGGLTAALVAF